MHSKLSLLFLNLFIALSLSAQTGLIVPVAAEPGVNTAASNFLYAQPTTIWVNYVYLSFNDLTSSDSLNVFFHDENYNVMYDRMEVRGNKNYSWFGTNTDGDGSMIISVLGNDVQGILTKGNEIYRLLTTAKGSIAVVHIDQSQHPAEACFEMGPLVPESEKNMPNPKQQKKENHIKQALESGCTIKGLVMYTPAAEAAMKGSGNPMLTDVKNAIQLAVSSTNKAFKESEITDYDPIELVQISLLNFEEGDKISPDLHRFKDSIIVQNLRGRYNADFCMLITDNVYDSCGYAFYKGSSSFAYGLVSYSCMTDNLSFAHEIGHMFGADHDANAGSEPLSLSGYNHGYIYYPGKWRTIMSYNAPCDAMGYNCTRLPFYSNPDVLYSGSIPMGTVAKENNAKTCRNSYREIARFNQPRNNFSLSNITYQSNTSLYTNILAKQNITSFGSVIVQDSATLFLKAGEQISLNNGFSTETNVDVHIKIETIEDCP